MKTWTVSRTRGPWAAIVVAAVLGSITPAAAVVPAAAPDQQRARGLAPADVTYTFNKVRAQGVADRSRTTQQRLKLRGDWQRAIAANGEKDAVAFMPRSLGAVERSSALVPKRRAFAVAMTVKVRRVVGKDSPNLAQQGLYDDRGQWKIELLPASGKIRLRLKGSAGTQFVTSRRSINDGRYHHVVCYRLHGKAGVIIDGHKLDRNGKVGAIRSSRKVTIANKHLKTSGDQFRGAFDYFSIALGHKPVARATKAAPTLR